MRLLVAAPVLGLPLLGLSLLGISLLGMGGEPRILLSERVDPAATADPPNLNVLEARPVSLHIVNGFSAEEEAKIIAAVGDWNQKGGTCPRRRPELQHRGVGSLEHHEGRWPP